MYTNLVTGETGCGNNIVYNNAVLQGNNAPHIPTPASRCSTPEPWEPPGVLLCCSQCSFSTTSELVLFLHVRAHATLSCAQCGQEEVGQPELNEHIRTHAQDCIYKCMECSHGAGSGEGLKQHYREAHPLLSLPIMGVSDMQPRVAINNLHNFSLEQLHSFMVQNGLKEINN